MHFERIATDSYKSVLYLNAEELEFHDQNGTVIPYDNFKSLLTFPITSFELLSPNISAAEFYNRIATVTLLFQKLSKEEKVKVVEFYIKLYHRLLELSNSNQDTLRDYDEYVTYASQETLQLISDIQLISKIRAIVDEYLSFDHLTVLGNRPQDTNEMTFLSSDIKEVTVIAVLCKFMLPIIGSILEFTKNKFSNNVREIYAFSVLKGVLEKHFYDITMKLKHYISKLVDSHLNNCINNTFAGNTETMAVESIFATIFNRRFIGINFNQPDSNLMTYIASSVQNAANRVIKNQQSLEPISFPTDVQDDGSGGNISLLENESYKSEKTFDIPVIIEVVADNLVLPFLDRYGLDMDLYKQAVSYYEQHPIQTNKFTTYLIATQFYQQLGGSKNCKLLSIKQIISLSTLVQLYLLYIARVPQLVPLLSMSKSIQAKKLSQNSISIINSWKNYNEKKELDTYFNFTIQSMRWSTYIEILVNYLVENIWLVNLPPFMVDELAAQGVTLKNGSEYHYDEYIIRDLLVYIKNYSLVAPTVTA